MKQPDSKPREDERIVDATKALGSALREACDIKVDRLDTGELIRVEEVLAIANEAAKDVISLRRGARDERERTHGAASTQSEHAPADVGGATSRTLTDATGRQWMVFAVHPSAPRSRAVLRQGFADGWLSFDAGDETRRVAPIPQGWDQLTDAALLDLCAAAESARPHRRPRGTRPTDEREPPRGDM